MEPLEPKNILYSWVDWSGVWEEGTTKEYGAPVLGYFGGIRVSEWALGYCTQGHLDAALNMNGKLGGTSGSTDTVNGKSARLVHELGMICKKVH